MIKTGIAVLAAACWLAAVPALADVQAGVDAYKAGDYKRAIDEWMPAAAKNDPAALFNLGQVYRLGKGVKPDLRVAESYYKRAAALGHVMAEGNLASLYLDRNGSLFDAKKGVEWLKKASYGGNTLSRYMLGVVYFNGDFVPTDYVEAYAWISLAAAKGFPDAVKAEQTVVSQMSVQQIAQAKKRAEVIEQKSDALVANAADQASKPSAKPADAVKIADADPASPDKAKPWVNPDAAPKPERAAPAAAPTPTPEPAPATTERPAPSPAGDYGIQIAAVRDESGARSAWKSLVAAHPDLLGGLTLNIERADLGEKGVFYRIQAGSLASLDDARSLCAKLKAQNVGCLPVRR